MLITAHVQFQIVYNLNSEYEAVEEFIQAFGVQNSGVKGDGLERDQANASGGEYLGSVFEDKEGAKVFTIYLEISRPFQFPKIFYSFYYFNPSWLDD